MPQNIWLVIMEGQKPKNQYIPKGLIADIYTNKTST